MMRTKKCKKCKELFQPYTTIQKHCTKDECIRAFINELKAKEEKKRQKQRKDELMTLQDYLKLTQQIFNKWIRLRDMGEPCISCGKQPKKANAGHYYSQGGHSNVRFDEFNCHLQCEHCNTFLSGNLIEYGINLEKKIGKEEFTILRERAYEVKKWSKQELLNLIEEYKTKIKNYQKEMI